MPFKLQTQTIVNHLKSSLGSLEFSESCNLFPLKFAHFYGVAQLNFSDWFGSTVRSDEKTFHGTMNSDENIARNSFALLLIAVCNYYIQALNYNGEVRIRGSFGDKSSFMQDEEEWLICDNRYEEKNNRCNYPLERVNIEWTREGHKIFANQSQSGQSPRVEEKNILKDLSLWLFDKGRRNPKPCHCLFRELVLGRFSIEIDRMCTDSWICTAPFDVANGTCIKRHLLCLRTWISGVSEH